ncbi:DedA family protein [Effusibacillus dendaii]|uniref:DedA family protein n=1 Tax=Effusibacillus dendaii TaxID=2743772 RepID=UPI001CF771D5|nr:DedA family protein [Effusibacillus dendaii]
MSKVPICATLKANLAPGQPVLFLYGTRLGEGWPIEHTVLNMIGVHGYIALFLSLVLGIVGLPIPDEVIMTYVGFLISQERMVFGMAWLVSFLGSVTGMSISYSIGRFVGLPFIYKFGSKLGIKQAHLERVQRGYKKFGPALLIIGYFIPGVRHLTAFSAGMSNMPILFFMFYSYIGGFIWTFTFLALGRMLGTHWNVLFIYMHRYFWWILAAALLLAAVLLIFRLKKKPY